MQVSDRRADVVLAQSLERKKFPYSFQDAFFLALSPLTSPYISLIRSVFNRTHVLITRANREEEHVGLATWTLLGTPFTGKVWSRTNQGSSSHASTGSSPHAFQHDILILTCSKGIPCWASEREREEASTWALFLGFFARTVPDSTPAKTDYAYSVVSMGTGPT